jgi:PEP-CTERM motif-containing protein
MKKLTVLFTLVLLFAAGAYADVTVTNASSAGWVQIGTSNTFGLPADLSSIGCSSENETTCEPLGVFKFNVAFATSGEFDITDPGGTVLSDQIKFFNDATTGLGVVTFASDPSLVSTVPSGTLLCVEQTASNGCVQAFTILAANLSTITLTAASDLENGFDPFGLGADSSDQIQITGGATINPTPEPPAMLLFGTGLFGIGLLLRKSLTP